MRFHHQWQIIRKDTTCTNISTFTLNVLLRIPYSSILLSTFNFTIHINSSHICLFEVLPSVHRVHKLTNMQQSFLHFVESTLLLYLEIYILCNMHSRLLILNFKQLPLSNADFKHKTSFPFSQKCKISHVTQQFLKHPLFSTFFPLQPRIYFQLYTTLSFVEFQFEKSHTEIIGKRFFRTVLRDLWTTM